MPADQRLTSHQLAGLYIDLRLKVQQEFVVTDGIVQGGFGSQSHRCSLCHLLLEESPLVGTGGLGTVHGDIGMTNKVFGAQTIFG